MIDDVATPLPIAEELTELIATRFWRRAAHNIYGVPPSAVALTWPEVPDCEAKTGLRRVMRELVDLMAVGLSDHPGGIDDAVAKIMDAAHD